MSGMTRRTLLGVLGLTMVSGQKAFARQSSITIGGSVPLTGADADLGQEIVRVFAAELGSSVQLEWLDDGGDAQLAARNLRTLAGAGCVAFVGVLGPDRYLAAQALSREKQIPIVALDCPGFNADTPLTFNLWSSPAQEAGLIIGQLQAAGVQSVGLIHGLDAGGRALQQALATAASGTGVSIDATIATKAEGILATNTRDLLTETRRLGAQAVVLATRGAGAARFATTCRTFGWTAPLIFSSLCDEQPLNSAVFDTTGNPVLERVALVRSLVALNSSPMGADLANYLGSTAGKEIRPTRVGFEAFLQANGLSQGLRDVDLLAAESSVQTSSTSASAQVLAALSSTQTRVDRTPTLYIPSSGTWQQVSDLSQLVSENGGNRG